MAWTFHDASPIYLQLVDLIKAQIIQGIYKPGDKLPSVRDLATLAAVNPNTMQKALSELENSGLIHTQRTSGRFITDDLDKITEIKKQLAKEEVSHYFSSMETLGFSKEEAFSFLEHHKKGDF